MLIVLKDHLAIANGRPITVSTLDEAPVPARKIVDKFGHALSDFLEVNYVQISAQANDEPSAITNAHDARGRRCHAAHCFTYAEQPLVACPMGQHIRTPP